MPNTDNHHTFAKKAKLRLPDHFMRPVTIILFISLYLVALLRPLAPVLEYYARQDYFADILCINKDKPQLHCNGQCILRVKLRAAMKAESAPSSTLPKVNFEAYPVADLCESLSDVRNNFISTGKANTRFNQVYTPCSGSYIFHPPQRA